MRVWKGRERLTLYTRSSKPLFLLFTKSIEHLMQNGRPILRNLQKLKPGQRRSEQYVWRLEGHGRKHDLDSQRRTEPRNANLGSYHCFLVPGYCCHVLCLRESLLVRDVHTCVLHISTLLPCVRTVGAHTKIYPVILRSFGACSYF